MKKDKKIYSGIVVILLFISGIHVHATNYYVSNSGNDTSNGTSPATAWATISKVNSSTFNPGDSIKFKCGDRWFEYLVIPSGGTPSGYITVTSYGTGAKPKLYGSIPATSFTQYPGYTNVYRINELVPCDLYYGIPGSSSRASLWFIVKDSVKWGDGQVNRKTSFGGLTGNFDFYWRNDSVYFYYDGDINDIDTVEIPQLSRGIDVTREYVTIDGLDLKYFASRCIGTHNYPEVTMHGFQLRNCELAYTASKEESVGYGMQLAFSDMIIEKNIAHDNGRRNLSLNLVINTGNAVMRNVIIQDNVLYNGYHTTGVDIALHADDQLIRNVIIRRNRIYDNYQVNSGHLSEGVSLISDGLKSGVDSIFVYNNIFQNVTLDALYAYNITSVIFVNNTMTGPGYSGAGRAFIFTASDTKITSMNNIFCNYTTANMPAIRGASDFSTVIDTSNYNLYYTTNNINSATIWRYMYGQNNYYYNLGLSPMQSLGFELNSPDAPIAPCFVDSISDMHLKSSSPAIGAGKPITFVNADFEGNPRDPLHPDIGAYEYVKDVPQSVKITKAQNNILSLYPNPVSNYLKIELSGEWNDNYYIQLFNICGKKIFGRENAYGKVQTINVEGFPKGTYIIMVSDKLRLKTAKFIIQ